MSKGNKTIQFRCTPLFESAIRDEFERWQKSSKYGGGSFSDFVRQLVEDELKHRKRNRKEWKARKNWPSLLYGLTDMNDEVLSVMGDPEATARN